MADKWYDAVRKIGAYTADLPNDQVNIGVAFIKAASPLKGRRENIRNPTQATDALVEEILRTDDVENLYQRYNLPLPQNSI